jgi:pantoate--beta-alanine ligase
MPLAESIPALRATVQEWRAAGESVAFIPTMGNLHSGHLRLVEEGKRLADRTVASIFVNPSQFCPGEDFDAYPRTPDADAARLSEIGTDLLFLPQAAELYPKDPRDMAFVEVPGLSDELCGRFRPGHFRGVTTIVCKLFWMVQPDVAVFGEKDFQQLTLIRRMVADLNVPVRIHAVPTVREANGLAMSSRNGYLTTDEKTRAALLYRCLAAAKSELEAGRRDYGGIEREQMETLRRAGFRPDYFVVRRSADLAAPARDEREFVILAAAWLGKTRLIDNVRTQI